MLPRLTSEHVVVGKIKKMKVRNAVQVLSERVSSIMNFLAGFYTLKIKYIQNYFYFYSKNPIFVLANNIMDEKTKDTVTLCLFFDRLFDSVNGNFDKVVDGKICRTGVKKKSVHHKLWNESLKILSTMVFVDRNTNKRSLHQPPTLKNWSKTQWRF